MGLYSLFMGYLGLYTSVVPKPMLMVFSLRTRLHVHMHTNLQNSILHNEKLPVLWCFADHDDFEATKTLNGSRALCWDKHQFHAKMTVSTETISLLNIMTLARKNTKRALSLQNTFTFSCLLRGFWATIWVLVITKALKVEAWAHKYAFSVFVVKFCGFCLSIVHTLRVGTIPTWRVYQLSDKLILRLQYRGHS